MGAPGQFGNPALAARLPVSQPGTLFGVPLATLRDPALLQKALLIAGIALLASIVVPINISPTLFVWKGNAFRGLIWPILVGLSYLLVAVAPANIRQSVPPIVLKWLPFGMAFASILVTNFFAVLGGSGAVWGANLGYPLLVFALLASLSNPQDQIARILIAVGAGLMLIPWVTWTFDVAFKFANVPVLFILFNLLQAVVFTVAVASAVFVVKPEQVPALRGVDAFKPLAAAILLAWLPIQVVVLLLATWIHVGFGLSSLLGALHAFIALGAYFGIIMLTAPEAYDEIKKLAAGGGSQPGPYGGPYGPPPGGMGGGYPPPGGMGGYPPPGGMGGGYPPPGAGGPPGGYPPPGGMGGGYPPAGGGGAPGGFPPPGGGYPPPGAGGPPGGYPPPGGMGGGMGGGGYPPPGGGGGGGGGGGWPGQ